jgi:hypothetical protein
MDQEDSMWWIVIDRSEGFNGYYGPFRNDLRAQAWARENLETEFEVVCLSSPS